MDSRKDHMPDTHSSFAEKLQKLFDTVTKPDGTKYTKDEVIQGSKGAITRVYLWQLRTGRAVNPGYHVILALADFFKVDPTYFFEDNEKEIQSIDDANRNNVVNQITLRSTKLDNDSQKAVLLMIDSILKSKGIDPEHLDEDD